MLITEVAKDGFRAEVHQGSDGYWIEYYSPNGAMMEKESFPAKSIFYVEDAAKNWIDGVKVLNG